MRNLLFPVTDSPPNCIFSYCKTPYCILEQRCMGKFNKIILCRKVFHLMVKIVPCHTKRNMTFVQRALCTKKNQR